MFEFSGKNKTRTNREDRPFNQLVYRPNIFLNKVPPVNKNQNMEHGAELDSNSLRPPGVDVKTNQPTAPPADIQEEVEQVRHRLRFNQTSRAPLAVLHLRFTSLVSSFSLSVCLRPRVGGLAGSVSRSAGSMTRDPDSAARLEAL